MRREPADLQIFIASRMQDVRNKNNFIHDHQHILHDTGSQMRPYIINVHNLVTEAQQARVGGISKNTPFKAWLVRLVRVSTTLYDVFKTSFNSIL